MSLEEFLCEFYERAKDYKPPVNPRHFIFEMSVNGDNTIDVPYEDIDPNEDPKKVFKYKIGLISKSGYKPKEIRMEARGILYTAVPNNVDDSPSDYDINSV